MNDYLAATMTGLFILSELLAFTKKTKGNGILHTLLCLLNGSECMIKKVKEQVQQTIDDDKVVVDVSTQTD